MSTTANINLDNLKKVVGEVYGEGEEKQLAVILEDFGLSGEVEFSRGAFYDGEISTPFNVKYTTGTAVQGILRFVDRGRINDGMTVEGLPAPSRAVRFLVALAFGSQELRNQISDQESKWLEGAKELYQCYQSTAALQDQCLVSAKRTLDTLRREERLAIENARRAERLAAENARRDENNRKTTDLILFGDQLLRVVQEERDKEWWIFKTWDPNSFKPIIDDAKMTIAALPSDTLEGSAKRLELATQMILKSLAIYHAAEACVKVGKCTVSYSFKEQCGYGERGEGVWNKDYYYVGNPTPVRKDILDRCESKKEPMDRTIGK